MQCALQWAQHGLGCTSPNPTVGAILVCNSQIIGEGFHHRAGEPHAEVMAITDAINRGNENLLHCSTLYVTLEPCSTVGKTGACTDLIIKLGIPCVVYGAIDPSPPHSGAAKQILNKAGIYVLSGILEDECNTLIQCFKMKLRENRAWVIGKSAMTLDGNVTRFSSLPKQMTGEESMRYVHSLRATCDAVITGGATIRDDNPALTVRLPQFEYELNKPQPRRIILTNNPSLLSNTFTCLSDSEKDKTIMCANVENIKIWLQEVSETYQLQRVLLECGGKLMRQFLEAKLVDEFVGIYAPMLSGGPKHGVAASPHFMPHLVTLGDVKYSQLGHNFCVRGFCKYQEL